jgi:hypothetical protein
MEVARHMEFSAAVKNGRRVASRIVLPVKFSLDPQEGVGR